MHKENLKPVRRLRKIYHDVECTHGEMKRVKRPNIEIRMEQDSLNLEYTEELCNYNNPIKLYNENKQKACALIFSYCNKVMQSRIEESSNFETEIHNDPLKLLDVIKHKMYNPARAKHEFVLLTELLSQLLTTLQSEDANLIDCMKRFKQVKDII